MPSFVKWESICLMLLFPSKLEILSLEQTSLTTDLIHTINKKFLVSYSSGLNTMVCT